MSIGDVEAPGRTGDDQTILLEHIKDRGVAVRHRDIEQIEVRGIVEFGKDVFAGQALGGGAVFEAYPIEHAPQRPFLLGVVLELPLGSADPDEFGTTERHRLSRRRVDLQQNDATFAGYDFVETEIDTRAQQAQQPGFKGLVPLLRT